MNLDHKNILFLFSLKNSRLKEQLEVMNPTNPFEATVNYTYDRAPHLNLVGGNDRTVKQI